MDFASLSEIVFWSNQVIPAPGLRMNLTIPLRVLDPLLLHVLFFKVRFGLILPPCQSVVTRLIAGNNKHREQQHAELFHRCTILVCADIFSGSELAGNSKDRGTERQTAVV